MTPCADFGLTLYVACALSALGGSLATIGVFIFVIRDDRWVDEDEEPG